MYPIPGIHRSAPGSPRRHRMRIEHCTRRLLRRLPRCSMKACRVQRRASRFAPPASAHLHDQINRAETYWLGTARAFDFPTDSLPARVRYAGPLVGDPSWVGPWQSPWSAEDTLPLVLVGFSHELSEPRELPATRKNRMRVPRYPCACSLRWGGPVLAEELSPAGEHRDCGERAPQFDHAGRIARGHSRRPWHRYHRAGSRAADACHSARAGPGRSRLTRVVARGAGLSLAASASVSEMHDAIERLLTQAAFKDAARRLGESVAAEARWPTLVDEMELLASRKRASDPSVSSAVLDRRATLKGLVATQPCSSYGLSRTLRAAPTQSGSRVDFSALRRSIAGEVTPIDSQVYESRRADLSWNMRKTKRQPQAIVRVRSAKDVCAAVRFAVARDLSEVAVRGGGSQLLQLTGSRWGLAAPSSRR